jgi:hypothetical protein
MRTLLVVFLIAVLGGGAAAQPAGWIEDREHAQVIERDLLMSFPEGAQARLALRSFRSPAPGGQLIHWALEVAVTGEGGDFVRTRIEDLRGTVEAMASGGGKARTLHWSEQADPKQHQVEALLEWVDDDTGVQAMVRSVWVRPKGTPTIREHRIECVLAGDAGQALRAACVEALARLAVTPAGEREPFALPGAPAAPDEPAPDEATGDTATMRETPPHVGPVLATREAPREERDLRPFYVGGFLLLVVAVLWWNRKRTAEALARAEAAEPKAEAKPEEPAEPLADEAKDDEKEETT